MKKIPQDIIGDIAILKFPYSLKSAQKKKLANQFLKQHKNIATVLEKTGKFKGRLRKPETKFIAGKKKKETIHTESDAKFYLDIDETYFSPRLSHHRKTTCEQIAKKLKNNSKVLVMFAGISPWPIILAKTLKTKYPKKQVQIISNEINRKANLYAKKNIKLNKVEKYIFLVSGDAKKLPTKLNKNYKADIILMPRPNIKETFLKTALKLSKKSTTIYYHGFGTKEKVLEEIRRQVGKKATKIKITKAGEIGVRQWRWLAIFNIN
tara:strand:- start:977 stop:1771 length:795 start_codon:yes stop_codon:yes gene_type:complete